MAKKTQDMYANVAALDITESAANTLTVAKFAFPFSIMDKMGLLINRIEYEFASLTAAMAATGDQLLAGIVATATPTLTDPTDPSIIDVLKCSRLEFGAAASGNFIYHPYVKDFSTLPGGGLLVAPNPLYGAIMGDSAGAAGRIKIRMFYTYMELGTEEYWQLVESRRVISV